MGARKRESANRRKEALKTQYFAKLNNVPTSPRKMRLAADMVRGMEVFKALGVLIVQRCLNVFVRLRKEEVTEFVNVRTM